ncbi:TonB-dependent receptor domain-containing protein [Rufibacter sp. LB8]|nr:TonB-dependent receptor [Rufibacter sp. LB8]
MVQDSSSSKAVQFATVSLLNAATGKPVNGTITDETGAFSFSGVGFGTYKLAISFLGYDTKTLPAFTLSQENKTVKIGTIRLANSATKLQEVTVVAQKPLIEDKGDKLVYNAEHDLTNEGTSASDVLRKVPSVTVDADGNVQLRGSSNLLVLMNGKPSSILANNLAEALKQIPADIIKSIEVITSPSAKYDAEGSAGIINIITKKNTLQGLNGKVSVTGSNRGRYANGSLNARKGKVGVTTNLSFYSNNNRRVSYTARENVLRQEGDGHELNDGAYGKVNLDFDPDTLNTFTLGLAVFGSDYRATRRQFTQLGTSLTNYDMVNNWNNIGLDANFGYTHTFKPKQELSVLAQRNQGRGHDNYDNAQFSAEGGFMNRLINDNKAPNQTQTYQLDYTQTFANDSKLEVGLKTILREASSNALYHIHRAGKADSLAVSNFDFDQDVYAAYLMYGFKLGKHYQFNLGSRYERTHTAGLFLNTMKGKTELQQSTFRTNYQNFIPSFTVSRAFKEIHTVRASYTQRIQRPQIWSLNPFEQMDESTNYYKGNPELDPELTHAVELGYSTYFKTSSLNAAVFYRQTDNAVQQLSQEMGLVPGTNIPVIRTMPVNIGENKVYGVSLSGSTKPLPKWSISPNLILSHVQYAGPGISSAGTQYSLSLNTSYDFAKGLTTQFNGNYNSAARTAQGSFGSNYFYTFALRKKLMNDKAMLTASVSNPFARNIRFSSSINTDAFSQETVHYARARRVSLSFSYSFGKMEASQRQKKTIQNDDALSGGK